MWWTTVRSRRSWMRRVADSARRRIAPGVAPPRSAIEPRGVGGIVGSAANGVRSHRPGRRFARALGGPLFGGLTTFAAAGLTRSEDPNLLAAGFALGQGLFTALVRIGPK